MMGNYDLGYDFHEALLRTNISRKDVENFKSCLPDNAPSNLTDKQLLLFLNACNGNVEDACSLVRIYFDTRKSAPEIFENRDPQSETIKQCLKNQAYFVIPPTRKEFCPIVYHKITAPESSKYIFDNAVKVYCMTMDVAIYKYGPPPGIIFLHDMELVGFTHLLRASLSSIRKFLFYLQNGLPASVCRIHILNVSPLFQRILSIVKPFLKKGLLDVIHIHQPSMDYDEFYKNWIPRSHLPADYGGDLASVYDLNQEFSDELRKMREYFLAEEQQRHLS